MKSYPMEHFEDGVYSLDSRYGEGDEQCRTMYLDVVNRQVRSWSLSRPQARAWLHRNAGLEGVAPLSNVILAKLRDIACVPNPRIGELKHLLGQSQKEGDDVWRVVSDYIVAGFSQHVSDLVVYDLHPYHQENESGEWPVLSGSPAQRLWGRFIRAQTYWNLYEGPGGWRRVYEHDLWPVLKGADPQLLKLALVAAPGWLAQGRKRSRAGWWIERKSLFASNPWTEGHLSRLLIWALGRHTPFALNAMGTDFIRFEQVSRSSVMEWVEKNGEKYRRAVEALEEGRW